MQRMFPGAICDDDEFREKFHENVLEDKSFRKNFLENKTFLER